MYEPTIHLTGNVAAKPSLRPVETPTGTVAVASLRVAVTPRRRGRGQDDWSDGETMWFTVTVWRAAAERCVTSLNQGNRVAVRGRLTQRTWRDAQGAERVSLEVDADSVALDLSRQNVVVLGSSTPGQRQPGGREAADGQPDPDTQDEVWVSTGQVDADTGEVLVTSLAATVEEDAAEPAGG